jgi:hypothetical protein
LHGTKRGIALFPGAPKAGLEFVGFRQERIVQQGALDVFESGGFLTPGQVDQGQIIGNDGRVGALLPSALQVA